MTNKQFAVLGSPIDHSLSPAIHAAAYKHLNLDWSYERFEVKSGELSDFIDSHRDSYSGFSITMPLKIEAAELADQKDSLVELLGVANTLMFSEAGIAAFNTDVFGITQALEHCWSPEIQTIAILGAGATARSALAAIHLSAPMAKVMVYVRAGTNTKPIADLASTLDISLEVAGLDSYGSYQELTINTLPAKASPAPQKQAGWLLDVNYSSQDEDFVNSFDPSKVVSGKAMLLWQAIAQIRLFTSSNAHQELQDEAAVLRAMTAALQ